MTRSMRSTWSNRLRACRFGANRELLDLALGRVEALAAEAIQLLASLPEPQGFVERGLAALEALDNLLELALGLLEGALLAQRTSSTRAPKPPLASSTSTRSPRSIDPLVRRIASSARTIA
jgi:hypothetical protein